MDSFYLFAIFLPFSLNINNHFDGASDRHFFQYLDYKPHLFIFNKHFSYRMLLLFLTYIAFFLQAKFRYLTILLLICLLTIDHSESWRRRRFRRFTRRIGRAIRRIGRTVQTVNTAVGVIRAVGAIAGAGKRSADDVCFYELFFVTK